MTGFFYEGIKRPAFQRDVYRGRVKEMTISMYWPFPRVIQINGEKAMNMKTHYSFANHRKLHQHGIGENISDLVAAKSC